MKSQSSIGTTSNQSKKEKTEGKKKRVKKSNSNFSKEYTNKSNKKLLDEESSIKKERIETPSKANEELMKSNKEDLAFDEYKTPVKK